jgi:hypothetical protein
VNHPPDGTEGREAVVEEALEVDQQRTAVEDAALTPVQLSGWGHKEHSFVLAKAHLEKAQGSLDPAASDELVAR